MDLVYIPEVLTYGSFRSPQYRDYEQFWKKNNSDYGANNKISTYQHHRRQNQRNTTSSKDNCHLCKENKRRSLAAYIRGKTRNNSCNEISEEEEEETGCSAGDNNCHKSNESKKTETKIETTKKCQNI